TNLPDNINGLSNKSVVLKRTKKRVPHVSHNSGNNNWYTPGKYIEAAKDVMDDIDLDPASSVIANKTVGAKKFYTEEQNGLTKPWSGRVWMNPPYSQPLIKQFSDKLVEEIKNNKIAQAIVLVNNATETKWFQKLFIISSAVCFPKPRIKFLDIYGNVTGSGPTQGQSILYFGNNQRNFSEVFNKFGIILWNKDKTKSTPLR
ncbi:MAG: DNA N-6-adenine-methyltransferase, partial [Candidatus Parcubacteria bacterium]|nr:DNA N-6-adenine-methyltransferase [Candidatus Parcubacteria bacterium]